MRVILILLLFGFSVNSYSEYYNSLEYKIFGEPAAKSDKLSIDILIDKFWKAWSSQDSRKIVSLHTKDVEWTNAFGRSFRGSSDLERFFRLRLFPMFSKETSEKEAKTYQPISRRYIGSEAAIITGRIESERGSSVGSTNRRIQFIFILKKNSKKWKISNQIINDVREKRG